MPFIAARKPQHHARTSQLLQARRRPAKLQQNVDSQRRHHHGSIVFPSALRSPNGQERHFSASANGGTMLPLNECTYRAI